MPEYCGVISDKPATGAKLEQVLEEEKNFSFELLEKAIANRKVEFIDKVLERENLGDLEVEVVSVPFENSVVIDIREEPKEAESPLILENIKILKIPFFDITYDFEKLDQSKTYLFYCDK
jgi:thiamine biosynthesis protein ThiI